MVWSHQDNGQVRRLISYHCGQKAMPVVGHKCSTLPLHYLVSFVLCSSRKNLLVSVEFGKMINKLLEVSTMSEYQSNVSREQFELIWPGLEGLRKLIGIRSRHYDLYNVFNAILYSLTTGCRWRELPHDFSEWHTVYRYCDMWRDKPDPTVDFLLEKLLKKLLVPIASRKVDRPERRSSLMTRRH